MTPEADGPTLRNAMTKLLAGSGLTDEGLFSLAEFMPLMVHAAAYRFGLAVEITIEALSEALEMGDARVTLDHFAEAYYGPSSGYPCSGQRTQNYIWNMVRQQAKRQGIIGIHYDECQHMFSDTGHSTNRVVLDSFKALLKDPSWPLILILSGVPDLATHIENDTSSEERRQLRHLLRPVHFDMINPERDLGELNELAYSYADKAGVNFDGLSNADFLERLAFVSCNRWGLAIEMVIEAFTCCSLTGEEQVSMAHFDEAFSRTHGTQKGFSPFIMDDYIDVFDQDRLLKHLSRDD